MDAEKIYDATVGQRKHIIHQLEEAERNARDALFALEMVELELARETATMKSTISCLSETLPTAEFDKMCDYAFGQSKKDWEKVWKHEWVNDGAEKEKFSARPKRPSKEPRPNPLPPPPASHIPSSPLPPSSPPPPTSPINMQGHISPRPSPVHTNGVPTDGPVRPPSPPTLDGFRAPRGFVDNFGSTRYRPTAPEPGVGPSQRSRRLKRDARRLESRSDGTLVLVDPGKEIEARPRDIRKQIQAQQRLPVAPQSMLKIVQRHRASDRVWDPPVIWSSIFNDKEPRPDDLKNPFAQEPEPEANPYVQGDQS